jgi:hypothetical protein
MPGVPSALPEDIDVIVESSPAATEPVRRSASVALPGAIPAAQRDPPEGGFVSVPVPEVASRDLRFATGRMPVVKSHVSATTAGRGRPARSSRWTRARRDRQTSRTSPSSTTKRSPTTGHAAPASMLRPRVWSPARQALWRIAGRASRREQGSRAAAQNRTNAYASLHAHRGWSLLERTRARGRLRKREGDAGDLLRTSAFAVVLAVRPGSALAVSSSPATGEMRDGRPTVVPRPAFVSARVRGASAVVVTPSVREREPRRARPRRGKLALA